MLDSHPDLLCPGEADFLTDHLRPDGRGGWVYDREALLGDRIFRDSRTGLPRTQEAPEALGGMIDDLRGGRAGCLVLDLHRGLDRMLDLLPGVRILHLLRDPRDVALSAVGMGWAGNVYHGAETWLGTERLWEVCRPRFSPAQVHELRYEDLVRSPEAELTGICRFLGLDYDRAMLSYVEGTSYEAPDASLAEQWRRTQTPRELGLVEPRLGALLTARGYAPSGHPAIVPGPGGRLALWWQNKRAVWRGAITRHGLADTLMVAVGRRVKLCAAFRRAETRIADRSRSSLR